MSLGLLSGYGDGSDSDNSDEEENQIQGILVSKDTPVSDDKPNESDDLHLGSGFLPSGESVLERLKFLASEAGVEVPDDMELALCMPPPPPPSSRPPPPLPSSLPPEPLGPLPNPLKHKKPKTRLPAIGRREMEMLKTANWTEITTEAIGDGEKQEFEYNTPLPFTLPGQGGEDDEEEESQVNPQPAEYDYVSYVAEYQNYMASSATLLEGQAKSQEEGGSSSTPTSALDPDYTSPHTDEWSEYMQKYSEWYAQYGSQGAGVAAPSTPTEIKQKSFNELVEQDRQLSAYFDSAPANEYNSQRDAFKSSFRGTRMYRMKNDKEKYNPKHFNQLSQGAKAFKEMYPKQKSVFVDKDAYVADKDLPENQDPKSLKQRKKDKWFERMKKKGGCKKCGYVFCRCYGWEFKPSHVK
eukprot:GFUD01041059.1.p1 GENE.GFUD01041059.1~~GFUD01041059.1.p1  ORF type:complete len:410 (+),score=143.28 GFUD01041059.1:53-1282(+)